MGRREMAGEEVVKKAIYLHMHMSWRQMEGEGDRGDVGRVLGGRDNPLQSRLNEHTATEGVTDGREWT